MGRFFSFSGMSPSGGEGNMNVKGGTVRLPDPYSDPRMSEWAEMMRDRPTSHDATGVDGYNHFRGEVCEVLHEEKDQHTGAVEQTIRASDATGSGTHRVTWKPDGARRLTIADTKRIHE